MLMYETIITYDLIKSKLGEIPRKENGNFDGNALVKVIGGSWETIVHDIYNRSDQTFVFNDINVSNPSESDAKGYIYITATARPKCLREGLASEFRQYVSEIWDNIAVNPQFAENIKEDSSSMFNSMMKYITTNGSSVVGSSDGTEWFSGLNTHLINILKRPGLSYGSILFKNNRLSYPIDNGVIEQLDLKNQIEKFEKSLDSLVPGATRDNGREFNNVPLGIISMIENDALYNLDFILHNILFKRGIIPTYDYVIFDIDRNTRMFDNMVTRIFVGWMVIINLTGEIATKTIKRTIKWIESMTSSGIIVSVDLSMLTKTSRDVYIKLLGECQTSRNWFVFKETVYTEKEARVYLNRKARETYAGTLPKRITWPKDIGGKTKAELDKRFNETIRNLKYTRCGLQSIDNFLSPFTEKRVELEAKDKPGAMQKLQGLIGLETVKKKVDSIVKYNRMYKKYIAAGMEVETPSYNMVFYGNPGTAKTTCARLVAEIFSNEGIVKNNTFSELTRTDLCAAYVGQTAMKTRKALDDAVGGVILIDEAYSLSYSQYGGDYGTEAITEIVASMEANAKDTVFIFAGYENEMVKFIESNPGLSSRIPNMMSFPDYSKDDLLKILETKFKEQGFEIDSVAKRLFGIKIDEGMKKPNFGNGRFVRSLVEQAIVEHSDRLFDVAEPSVEELRTITVDDIPDMKSFINMAQSRIGFGN